MKLGHHKGTKVTELDLVGLKMVEKTHLGDIFDIFCPYLFVQLL